LIAGDANASRAWYANAQRGATQTGDHAAIGAITYNRAALRVAVARFTNLTKPVSQEEASLLNAEVNSAINYQAAAELKSLDYLLGTAKAGVLMLLQRFEQAKLQIEGLLQTGGLPVGSSQQKLLLGDLAFIKSHSGDIQGARAWTDTVLESAGQMMADDRAVLLSTASAVAAVTGDRRRELEFIGAAASASAEHVATMRNLLQQISMFKEGSFQSVKAKRAI
jgi:hypothetical protein